MWISISSLPPIDSTFHRCKVNIIIRVFGQAQVMSTTVYIYGDTCLFWFKFSWELILIINRMAIYKWNDISRNTKSNKKLQATAMLLSKYLNQQFIRFPSFVSNLLNWRKKNFWKEIINAPSSHIQRNSRFTICCHNNNNINGDEHSKEIV